MYVNKKVEFNKFAIKYEYAPPAEICKDVLHFLGWSWRGCCCITF